MKKWLAGAGLLGLCGLACAAPFLFVGGAGLIGFGSGSWLVGSVLILASIIVVVFYNHHKKNKKNTDSSCSADGSCGCKPTV